jgi:glycosyltransferase involved in cell wall biosynthesis
VIHAHLLGAAEIKALRPHGIPVVLTLHNTSQGWPADLTMLEEKDLRLLAACSLGVTADARRLLPRLPVRTAWNGIDWRRFQLTPEVSARGVRLRHSLGLCEADVLLVALANPRPQKRLDRLPAVVAALQALCPDRRILLVVAGQAAAFHPEAAACVEAVKAAAFLCGAADHVVFRGAVEDVPALLAAADVLVSAAAHEGLSLAHLEALAMGVPVVALEAGGTGEVAAAARGLMVRLPQEATAREFAGAVLSVITAGGFSLSPVRGTEPAPDRQRPAARGGDLRRCFSLEAMTRRYLQLYRTALLAPAGPGKTVWLVTNNFSTGGAQSSARRLLRFWQNAGIPVRVAVLQERDDDPTPGLTALTQEGITVTILPALGRNDAPETLEPLWPELAADPPAALLFWNAVTSCKRLIAEGLPRTPVFDVSPGGMFFESLHPSFERLRPDAPALSPADYGAQLAGAAVKYSREKPQAEAVLGIPAHVIPNGIDLENPETVAASFRENPERFIFGTAARLHPQKRLEDLLEAFRLALPDLPQSVLRIAGGVDGGELGYVENLKTLAVGLPVEWVGLVEPVARFYKELDVMVMISEPAGCPNASLEALAAGLPVIATDFGGASEQVITGHTGILVPARDAAALAAAMIRMAGDAELRRHCAVNARKHILENFSVSGMAGRYLEMTGLRMDDDRTAKS